MKRARLKDGRCPLVLRLGGRRSSDVNFHECSNEGDSMERVTDPYHRKAVGKSRHNVWGGITLELNAPIEIVDGFPEPQADNQERGDTCRSLHQRQVVKKNRYLIAYRS